MSTYAYRFVGQESLPARLPDFDLEQFFQLTEADIAAVTDRFRADRRVAGALQLLFLRAMGRPMSQSAVIPRNLLKYVTVALNAPPLSIASLRSLYERAPTLYDHQGWARKYLGIRNLDAQAEAAVVSMLQMRSTEASHTDDLIAAACHWLYEQRIQIPGERRVRDWARNAFATTEAEVLRTILGTVSPEALKQSRDAVYSVRADGVDTHLEWLKTPSKRHGQRSLNETLAKIRYLKALGVNDWQLGGIAIPKQRAYAQHVQARRPAKTRELIDATQTIELVCFLNVSLLELTDVTIQQSHRRSQQLFREATQRAKAAKEGAADSVRQRVLKVREVLRDKEQRSDVRCREADRLLTEIIEGTAGSFASRVRQVLAGDGQRVQAFLAGMEGLAFGGAADDAGFKHWSTWRELRGLGAPEFPAGFAVPEVGDAWRDLVHDEDRKRGLQAFAACTMMAMRKSLRSGKLWIDHSLSFRERDQVLIPADEWARERDKLIATLGFGSSADSLLDPLLANLKAGLSAVAEACAAGKIHIGTDGMLHLPAVEARPDDGEPRRTRDLLFKTIGKAQLPDILLEMDVLCNFSEALLGHRAETEAELLSAYAALLAQGTDVDAKGVAAMIPGIDATQVSVAMRALEMHGRLRRANERLTEFQGRIPLAEHWGTGERASADMMSMDVSRHLWTARVDPRRRTYAAGIYTHVLDRWGIVYDQPIVLSERQAGVAIEGVEQHNRSQDRIQLSLLAVDTHGYTNPAMSIAKLLGFDLCPRLRDLSERKLYLPAKFEVPQSIDLVTVKRVSLKAIRTGWDELLRIVASIRLGRISAELALRYLSSAAKGDPAYEAAENLGRLLRSVFLCDFVTIDDFRREIHTLLSRGESVHLLQRAIYDGKVATDRGRRRDEMRTISGAHALLTNIVIGWNTNRMNKTVERLRKDGVKIEDEWIRRMGPVHFGNINFRGTFRFGVERFAEALIRRGSANPARAAS